MRGAPTHGESSQNWRDDKCIICDQEVDCVGDTAQESHRARSSLRSLLKRTQDRPLNQASRYDATLL